MSEIKSFLYWAAVTVGFILALVVALALTLILILEDILIKPFKHGKSNI